MDKNQLKDAIKQLSKVQNKALSTGNQETIDACKIALSLLNKEFYKELSERDDNLIIQYINSKEFQDMLDDDPYDNIGYEE